MFRKTKHIIIKNILLVVAAVIASALGCRAQGDYLNNIPALRPAVTTEQAFDMMRRADTVSVSFVNFFPGPEIYELEGHSVLRLTMRGLDLAISYGTFDFNAPNFVYRFVKGETDYWVTMSFWEDFEHIYKRQDRRIVEHPILMDSLQRVKLLDILSWNFQPRNRTYRYNYVKDNCSLRPLRVLQQAIGDSLRLPQPDGLAAQAGTYREMMRLYHRNYPWYQFGIDLALGAGIDQPISAEEKAFAPIALDSQLPGAMVNGKPLTRRAYTIHKGSDVTLSATPWILSPMAVCLAVLLLSVIFTMHDCMRMEVSRWFDAIMYGIFGLVGLFLTFLIFESTHEATSPNWLYLWLNPLCLLVPLLIWLKKLKIIVISYQIANFALLIALVVVLLCKVQSANAAFYPLIAADALRSFNYVYVSIRQRKAKR